MSNLLKNKSNEDPQDGDKEKFNQLMKALIKGDKKSQSREEAEAEEEEDPGPSSQSTQINWLVSMIKDNIINFFLYDRVLLEDKLKIVSLMD